MVTFSLVTPCFRFDVTARQKPGSDDSLCKASSRPRDGTHGHSAQGRAGWRRSHSGSSPRGTSSPGILRCSCRCRLPSGWSAACRHYTGGRIFCSNPGCNRLLQPLPEQIFALQFVDDMLHRWSKEDGMCAPVHELQGLLLCHHTPSKAPNWPGSSLHTVGFQLCCSTVYLPVGSDTVCIGNNCRGRSYLKPQWRVQRGPLSSYRSHTARCSQDWCPAHWIGSDRTVRPNRLH